MKKRLLIGILGFAGLLTACSEDEIDFYTGPAAVNITIDGDGTFVQAVDGSFVCLFAYLYFWICF